MGAFEVAKIGARRFDPADPYHFALTISWTAFFGYLLAAYIAIGFVLQALVRVPVTQAMYPVMAEGVHAGDARTMLARLGEVFASPLIAGVLIGYVVVSFVLSCVVRLAWFGVNAYTLAANAEPDADAPAAS